MAIFMVQKTRWLPRNSTLFNVFIGRDTIIIIHKQFYHACDEEFDPLQRI